MDAIRIYRQINKTGSLILDNLPFKKGELVEVLILPAQDESKPLGSQWELLFKDIQSNNSAENITDSDIIEQIQDFRKGI